MHPACMDKQKHASCSGDSIVASSQAGATHTSLNGVSNLVSGACKLPTGDVWAARASVEPHHEGQEQIISYVIFHILGTHPKPALIPRFAAPVATIERLHSCIEATGTKARGRMHHSDSEDEGAPRVSYQVASALRQDALRPQAEQCRSSTKDHQHQPVQLIVSDDEADEPHIPFAQEPIPVQDTDSHQGAPKAGPAGFSSLFAGSSFKANASRAPAAKALRSTPAARAKAKAGKAKALDVRSLTAKRPRQEAPASNPNAADAAGPSDPGPTPMRTMLAMFQPAPEASRAAAPKPRGAPHSQGLHPNHAEKRTLLESGRSGHGDTVASTSTLRRELGPSRTVSHPGASICMRIIHSVHHTIHGGTNS